jgi:predicted DNA-binding transcriptional regulator AlpA
MPQNDAKFRFNWRAFILPISTVNENRASTLRAIPMISKLLTTSFLHKLTAHSNTLPLTPEQTFITIKEVCRILNISDITVWRRCSNPKHPSYDPNFPKPRKFGGNIRRWQLAAVLRYAGCDDTCVSA